MAPEHYYLDATRITLMATKPLGLFRGALGYISIKSNVIHHNSAVVTGYYYQELYI